MKKHNFKLDEITFKFGLLKYKRLHKMVSKLKNFIKIGKKTFLNKWVKIFMIKQQ